MNTLSDLPDFGYQEPREPVARPQRTLSEVDSEITEVEEIITSYTDADGEWRGTFHIWEALTDELKELRAERERIEG